MFSKKKKASSSGIDKKQAKDLARLAKKLNSKKAVKRVNREHSG
ncbi:hypothetical protein PUS82_00420 [Cytobacillus firmus]|nr:hypothetical protein [Cytobacillus firmus]MDD9309795.1 hypothetical protein [Cytobacillus firmus]